MPARTRSKTNVPNTYEYYYVDYSVGGTDTSSGPYLTAYDYETMSDVVVPNFKKLKSQGKTIINPLTYRREYRNSVGTGQSSATATNASGQVTSAWSGYGPLTSTCLQNDGIPPLVLQPRMELARREAILMAISGIDSTPLATGEDVLELGETIRFLRSPLQGILKELKKRKISSLVDVPTSAWLTYRFAFSPLVRSVHDILSEVREPTKQPADIRVSHGRVGFHDKKSGDYTYVPSASYSRTMARSSSIEGNYHATIRYRLRSPVYDWRWRYGLRNKDLPEAFWAVMPLSFMVDRILDVSSFIGAARALSDPSVSILGSSITLRSEQKTSYRLVSQSTTIPRLSYSGTGETVNINSYFMRRTAFSPSLGDIIPPFKPRGLVSDLTKIADLAALLRVFTKR